MNQETMIFLLSLMPLIVIILVYVFFMNREQDKHTEKLIADILKEDREYKASQKLREVNEK